MNARNLVYTALAWGALVGCGGAPPAVQPTVQPDAPDARAAVHAPRTCASAGFPTSYDRTIAQAERRYLPASWRKVAPCGWRAQLAAESGLDDKWCHTANPHGTSAACLAQITVAAADDAARKAAIVDSRTNPQASIRAGAWYLASMRKVWSEPRSVACRRELAVASYHGGAGTLLRGQALARAAGRTARCYRDGISEHLRRHRAENVAYVDRVHTLQRRMSR